MSRAIETAKYLIDKYCITDHRHFDLKAIANAEFLIIEEVVLKGKLGQIIFNKDYGLILINKLITNIGLKRFTIGHEMGHYFISKNSEWNKHGCTYESLGNYKSDSNHEAEANKFAAELLMHKPWFSKFIKNIPVNMDLIKNISEEFQVSLTAAAIRYAEIGQFPIAVIMSKNSVVQWSFINEYFPCRYLRPGSKVPKESNVWDYFKAIKMSEDADLVQASKWFSEDFKCKNSTYFYEQSTVIPVTDSVLTILWQSEFE
jgi:Zn-dependent peptidase ImmA (M78 family)